MKWEKEIPNYLCKTKRKVHPTVYIKGNPQFRMLASQITAATDAPSQITATTDAPSPIHLFLHSTFKQKKPNHENVRNA